MRPSIVLASLALVCLTGTAVADAQPTPAGTVESVPNWPDPALVHVPADRPVVRVPTDPAIGRVPTDPTVDLVPGTVDATGVEPTGAADATEAQGDAQGEDVVASLGTAIGEPSLSAQGELEQAVEHRIVWHEEWPRYSFDEAVLTLGLGLLLVAAEALPTATTSPNWAGGNPFDSAARNGLRLQLYQQRESARVAGDVLMWVSTAFPFVIDALLVTGLVDGSWDTTLQMGLISLEAYVVSLIVWRVTSLLVRRERPVVTACREGDLSPHCDTRQPTQSFFSNTAVNAFTGAGLTCLHHTVMPIFDDEAADATACVGAITVASVAGLLRVMSDFEYLSDVLTGAVVGFVSGYVLPWLLHYQGGARPELRAPVAMIPAPMVGPGDTYGVEVLGWF